MNGAFSELDIRRGLEGAKKNETPDQPGGGVGMGDAEKTPTLTWAQRHVRALIVALCVALVPYLISCWGLAILLQRAFSAGCGCGD